MRLMTGAPKAEKVILEINGGICCRGRIFQVGPEAWRNRRRLA